MEYKNTDSGFYESTKGRNGAMNVRTAASDIIQPVDIQAHYQQTIQTQTGAMVPPNGNNIGAWIDSSGFDKFAVIMKNDAAVGANIGVHWSNDGTTQIGNEQLTTGSSAYHQTILETKARYFRIYLNNLDAAAPHTMSAWAFLKA